MKSPENWYHEMMKHGEKVITWGDFQELVAEIQRDALSDPIAKTTDQFNFEMNQSIARNERIRADQLHDELMKTRAKWHEARKHLRAANKGAERNAQALALATTRYWDYRDSDRNEKQRDEYKHKTVVWNWLLMSDDEYRLKCGELSSQDLRNIRAVLKAMLGTSLLKHL
jgi:hypothetical protein